MKLGMIFSRGLVWRLILATWVGPVMAQSSIGIAKNAVISGREVTLSFTIENLGDEDLTNLALSDDLDAVFGAGNYAIVVAPSFTINPGSISLNAAFNGSGDTTLISTGSLLQGGITSFFMIVELSTFADVGSGVGIYSNQVSVMADDEALMTISDLSDWGTDPDPNGNNVADDPGEDDPTVMNFLEQRRIGVAKNVLSSGNFVTIDFYLENFGNVALSDLVLDDDLDAVFGTGNYTIDTAPAFVDDPMSITLNAGFDGSGDTALITSGSLAVADTAQIRMVVEITNVIDQGMGLGVYSNQVTAIGTAPSMLTTSDLSDHGIDPDPDGNGNPTGTNEDDPTVFTAGEEVIIGVAKDAAVAGNTVTIDIYIENFGNVTLQDLSIPDDLNAAFGATNFFVSSPPVLLDDPGTLTLNTGFDGNFDTQLITSGTLAMGESAAIRFEVEIITLDDLGMGNGVYENQVTASASSAGGGLTSDTSDDGTDPDPNGNNDPADMDEGDPTPITIAEFASIGIAKTLTVEHIGTPRVTLIFTVENLGNLTISSITIEEDLNAVYGAGNYIHVQDPTYINGATGLSYNSLFNGNTNTALLTTGTLAPGEATTFSIQSSITNITDQGLGLGIYSNQVTVIGLDPGASPVSDLSDEGSVPDSDGDGNADEAGENDPTIIDVNENPVVGIAKDVSVAGNTVTFDFYLENLGNVTMSEISVDELLNTTFGTGNYTLNSLTFIDDPGTLILNPSFNGDDDRNLFTIASSSLAVADTAQVRLDITVDNVANVGLGLGNYSNQVTVGSLSPLGARVSDDSDFGTDPDPNGNNDPDEAGENDATTFSISVDPIGVAKTATVAGFQVTIDLYLENLGATTLSGVSLIDNLDDVLGAGNYSIVTPPVFIDDPGTLTLNGAYDGSADNANLLAAGSTLTGGDTAQIQLVINVDVETDQGSGAGIYSNQALASGTNPSGVTASDLSDDGTDPDPNANNDPGDAGEDDPTTFIIAGNPVIGIALTVSTSGTAMTFDVYVENLGDVTLSNVLMQLPLNPIFGSGNYNIAQQPTNISGPNTLLLSSQYFGFSVFDFIVAGGTLGPGLTEHIQFVVNLTSGTGPFAVQMEISATGPGGDPTSDFSDNGLNPDPNGNGDPTEAGEEDPTPIVLGEEPVLGIAGDASVSGSLVTLDFYIENFSTVTLDNIDLSDDLDAVFGAGNYAIDTAPFLVIDPGTLVLNGGFDGSADTVLITNAGSTLGSLALAQIRMVVDVTTILDQGLGLGNYANQVSISANSPSDIVTADISDFGTDPDPNGNDDPNEAGENDTTTFTVGDAVIGVAKNVSVSGEFVTLDYYVANLGNMEFSEVSLPDDLDSVFGAGNYNVTSGPDIISAPRLFVPNANFDGSTDTELIASGGLQLGVTEQIRIVVQVHTLADLGSGLGVYSNQVTVDGDGLTDLSDNGTDPDSDGDGDPAGAGNDDPTPITVPEVPLIGVAKDVSVSGDQVTFNFYLENFGNTVLSNLALPDDLDAVLGAGTYSINSGPTLIDDPGTVTLNGSYNGSGDTALITSGTLAINDTLQFRVIVDVAELTDQGSGAGVYSNQVTATAQSPNATMTSDASDDGTDPDPNGDDNPDESGENDASSFTLTQVPVIGVAKDASVSGDQVTIDFYLENFGNVALENLSLPDDLDSVLGAGNYTVSSGPTLIDDPGTIMVNSAFDGSSDTQLITSGTLPFADTAQIRIVVDLIEITDQGSGLGVYSNQVTVSAQSPDATATTDSSDAGTDPDPDGDNNPDESGENDPTPFTVSEDAVIGVAKDDLVSGRQVTLDLYLNNYGNVPLSGVSLTDDLDASFGAGTYTITSAPAFIVDPGSITLNGGYDGAADTQLINSGSLAVGASAQIQMTVEINQLTDMGSGLGVYSNQASASGTGAGGGTPSDLSDDGTNPDPDGDEDPTEAGENDPTAITVDEDPIIGVSKTAAVAGNTVTLNFYLENFSNVDLENLALADSLDAVLGAGNYTVTGAPTLIDDPGTITTNAAFDGSGSTALITAGTLAYLDTAQINVVVEVSQLADLGSGLGAYSNQVTASAQSPDATMTSDTSDDGTDPDPDGDGNPNEVGENDATPFVIAQAPILGVAKDVSVSGDQITMDFYLENFGNSDLNNLTLTDNLDAVLGAGNYTVSTGPTLIDDPGTITANGGFDGTSDSELITTGTLAFGDTAQLRIVVDLIELTDQGSGLGVYSNQATAAGTSPDGSMTSDTSDDGVDPDPDGDSNPDEAGENDATAFTVTEDAIVGVAKDAATSGAQVTLVFTVTNYGNVPLSSMSLTDDLDTALTAGTYAVSVGPTFLADPGTLTLNAGFDGSADTDLITSGSLAVGATAQIQITVDVNQLTDTGSGLGSYLNQATASGTGSGGSMTTDTSDDGTNPDTDGDEEPNEAGENDLTPFTIDEAPLIGVAKDVNVSGSTVTIDFYLENFSNTDLSNLALSDDLDAVLGAGNYSVTPPSLIDDPGTITVNAAFDGSSDTDLITSGTLTYDDTAQIRVTVDVLTLADLGSGLGVYTNQVTASGQSPNGTPTSDLSDDGTDPDPNGDDDPTQAGENDTSDFTVSEAPIIGVAKNATVVENVATMSFYLENLGNVDLSAITLPDDLNGVFGAGNFTVLSGPTLIDDPGTITVNPSFDGGGDTDLITSGTLATDDTAEISITVLIGPGAGLGSYTNQVTASAMGPGGGMTTDLSNWGIDPDPNGNGDPTEAGENDPTEFDNIENPVIGVAKSADIVGRQVVLSFHIANLGNVGLTALEMTDHLSAVFGGGNYTVVEPPSLASGPTTVIPNPNFDGSDDIDVLSGTLPVGTTAVIEMTVEITTFSDQGMGTGIYSNQVTINASGQSVGLTSDISDWGTNPDPNNNANPTEAGENDPTIIDFFEDPVLGVAKDVSLDGTTVTFNIYLENLGNATLQDISLPDDLDSVFGAGNYTLTTGPTLIVDPGTLTVNAGFDGSADTALLSAGTLTEGANAQISMVVEVDTVTNQGAGVGVYANQIAAEAGAPNGAMFSELSDYGTDPDPDGDGNPNEAGENDPTVFVIGEEPAIGVAKTADVAASAVTLNFYLENLGNVTLDNLSLIDDLNAVLGAGNFFVSAGPTLIADPGTLSLNPGYDGNSDTSLLGGGTLAVGASAQIQVVVDILTVTDQGAGVGVYSNQVSAGGQAPGGGLTADLSDDGTDPDPNGNGDANEAGENDPTLFTVAEIAQIGMAKQVQIQNTGNIEITFTYTVENFGNVAIDNLSIDDDLDAVFGAGNYTILNTPSYVTGEPGLTFNGSFNGSGDMAMLTGGNLGGGLDSRFEIVVRLDTVSDQGLGLGIYSNQVTVNGTDPGANPVSDLSHTGTDPDPNGNGDPTETGENDPTVFNVNENPAIGIAKDVSLTGTQLTVDLYLENLGDAEISQLAISENLNDVFGAGNFNVVSTTLTNDPGTLNVDATFDGDTNNNILLAGSTLDAADTATIRVVVDILKVASMGLGLGNYENQAFISGLSPFGTVVEDSSDDGTDPDPDGDGDANEAGENDPSAFAIPLDSRIGVAKDVTINGMEVTVDLYLENLGTVTLSDLLLEDGLDAVFGAGNYTVTATPTLVDDPGTLTLNPGYDGTDPNLLSAGGTLAAGDTAQIQFTVEITTESDQGNGLGVYSNQAVATATEPGGIVMCDRSTPGVDPDPNGNDDPGDAGEDDPNQIIISGNPAIALAKNSIVNGTLVTTDFYLENVGDVTLQDIDLFDLLNNAFGAGNYTVVTPPTMIVNTGGFTANAAFDGSASPFILFSGQLAPGEFAQCRIQVDITNVTDQGSGLGVYFNQATTTATAPGMAPVSDLSDDGVVPDPNGNGDGSDAGEDDPTQTIIGEEAILGVAKDAAVTGTSVTISFVLENLGTVALGDLSLIEDLDAVFGAGNYTLASPPALVIDPGGITLNAGYDGSADSEIFDAADTLAAAALVQIDLTVDVLTIADQGDGLGEYSNQVVALGSAPQGSIAADLSDFGTDPDPNGSGNPQDAGENDPTTFSISVPSIGVAKNATVSGYDVTLDFYLENLGNEILTDVTLADDLDALFGAGNYVITAGPQLMGAPRDMVVNTAFDGSTDIDLVASGGLGIGVTEHIQLSLNVHTLFDGGLGLGVYSNQVTAFGEGSSSSVSDLSDDGTDPDPNGNNQADDAGEDDPTIFTIAEDPIIGVAKDVSVALNTVTFNFYLESFGNVTLESISVLDDLDSLFGAGNYSVTSGPTLIDDPGTLTTNAAFDGSADNELIGGGTLVNGDTASFTLVIEVNTVIDTGSGVGTYSNQVTADALSPGGTPTSDLSDFGTDPDPDGNNNPTDIDEDDPTPFTIVETPIIGVAKTATIMGRDVTFDIYLENYGNAIISNLGLIEDLDALLGAGNYTLGAGPTLIDDPGTLTANAAYDGSTDTGLLSGSLNVGDTAQIRISLTVDILADTGSGLGEYSNQVTITGLSPSATPVSDLSDDGTDPDPNGNNNPDEAGENDPTIFTMAEDLIIGVAKNVAVSTAEVTIDLYLENFSNVTLSSLSLPEDLATLFGALNYTISSGPALLDDPGTVVLNAAYDGNSDTALISGSLAPYATAQIRLVVDLGLLIDAGMGMGAYSNQVTLSGISPAGTTVSDLSDDGTDPDPDGDSNPDEAGENDPTLFNVVPASVGDFVWNDLNGNGVFDAGEPGLSGYSVFADFNSNGMPDAGEPLSTSDGAGAYDIVGLIGGTYDIVVDPATIVAGFVLITANQPLTLPVATGADIDNIDFGYQQQDAEIGDFVWDDMNGDGNQDPGEPGLSGVTIYIDTNSNGLLDGGEPFATTDAAGLYRITDLPTGSYQVRYDPGTLPANFTLTSGFQPFSLTLGVGEVFLSIDYGFQMDGRIGDFVWDDLNGDGIQDVGEPGLDGVRVYVDDNENGTYDVGEPADTTDVAGAYEIGGLTAGTYQVDIDASTLPAGFILTTANLPLLVTLATGEGIDTADFGYRREDSTIGDFVWHDTNGDGVQDPGEDGIPAVTIDLLLDTGLSGVIDSGDVVVGSTTTDPSGFYHFNNLPAGDYLVSITDTAGVLTNYVLTGGTDPHLVTLAVGETYNLADFGFCLPPEITLDPEDMTICWMSPVTFSVAAIGSPDLSYQWRKDGIDIAGATDPDYTIASVESTDDGTYDCVVTNNCGSATSAGAVLTTSFLEVDIIPATLVQGTVPLTVPADIFCGLSGLTWFWTIDATGQQFGTDTNPVTLPRVLFRTGTVTLHAVDDFNAQVTDFVTILRSQNGFYLDYNGDGCNTIEDLQEMSEEWRYPADDPNGDGIIDVRDFLYINTEDTCEE